jgi:hypothetical protein
VLQAICVIAVIGLTMWSFINGVTLSHLADRVAKRAEGAAITVQEWLAGDGR